MSPGHVVYTRYVKLCITIPFKVQEIVLLAQYKPDDDDFCINIVYISLQDDRSIRL